MGPVAGAREVAERFYERFGEGDMIAAFADFAPDCVAFTPSGRLDNERHIAAARSLKSAMPDGRMQLIRVREWGEEVYVTGWFRGTHLHELNTPLGAIPASGKSLEMYFTDYFRVAGGRIVECEAVWDRLGMVAQLGTGIAADVGHLPAALLARGPGFGTRG
ncbi:MAG TPA: nuclear transport factor 2 family protein [Acidimicrobiales bacterium]|nr:nuclear transport factor 2 family protein [Acidimicrobiales bacterium]